MREYKYATIYSKALLMLLSAQLCTHDYINKQTNKQTNKQSSTHHLIGPRL